MEARRPSSSATTAGERLHFEETVARLLADSMLPESGDETQRGFPWRRLQRELALFTGDNLLHMASRVADGSVGLATCTMSCTLNTSAPSSRNTLLIAAMACIIGA